MNDDNRHRWAGTREQSLLSRIRFFTGPNGYEANELQGLISDVGEFVRFIRFDEDYVAFSKFDFSILSAELSFPKQYEYFMFPRMRVI